MKGAPRVFGAIACGPVLDLNGGNPHRLTFILDRGRQVMGLPKKVRSPHHRQLHCPAHIPSTNVVASWHSMPCLTARAWGRKRRFVTEMWRVNCWDSSETGPCPGPCRGQGMRRLGEEWIECQERKAELMAGAVRKLCKVRKSVVWIRDSKQFNAKQALDPSHKV